MNFSKLIERIRLLLTTPKTEWATIAAEPATVGSLYSGYIVLIMAVPPLCNLIKFNLIGFDPLGLGVIRPSFGWGASQALLSYVLSLAALYVLALLVEALAPTFDATKDRIQALKTVAYAATASVVGSLGLLLPWLGMLIYIGGVLYSIYLLYLALPFTMKAPQDKAGGYTAVIIIVSILTFWVIGLVTAGLMHVSGNTFMTHTAVATGAAATTFDKDSPMGKMEAWSKRMDAAGKKMESAQQSGSGEARADAMSQMMGAVMGGANGAASALEPARLKGFVPDTLGGLARTQVSAQRNAALGLQIASATGEYADNGGHHLQLEVTDSGGASGLLGLASWAGVEEEKESASGYEHTRKEKGRIVHEAWDRSSGSGEYSVVLGDRFLVKVAGNPASVDDLKAAMGGLDLAGLEALKNEGAKPN